jgi:thiamine kinase-like enzyme
LTLEQALTRVPLWESEHNIQPIPLLGGITNRNFKVEVQSGTYVLRMSGENTELLGIHRPTECRANQAAARLGIAPEVVYFIEPEGYLVTRFIVGDLIPIETMRDQGWLSQVARSLHLFHKKGPDLGINFDIFEVIASLTRVAREHHSKFPTNFDWLMEKVRTVEKAFDREPYHPSPCHNDLLNANFLNSNGNLVVLDWEYAGMGDEFFDLANFSHHHALNDNQINFLLACYFGACSDRQFARLKLMEPLSDMREALWGTVQTGISTLDEDFAGYANTWYLRAAETFNHELFGSWLGIV